MIRMIQSSSAGHAKAYFSEALAQADYYINDQELQGKFEGRLAERLGIEGAATKENFFALAENIDPRTGKSLTPRTKEDRTVGYDINFHCPKSVSIVHALSTDSHVLEAFEKSVSETMQDIEKDSQTRVRKMGQYDDRQTGELAWASFTHQTARPVDDLTPDPHLHSHCFVFNATWDKQEKQFKAAKFRDIKRDMPYYQARFHKRLSDSLVKQGYRVRRTDTSFEIVGVPQNVIDLFSKRTDAIGRVAKEKGITDAKELDALGARTRSKKQKGLSMADLKNTWRKQINDLGDDTGKKTDSEQAVRFAREPEQEGRTAKECLDHALDHCFERASVMQDRRLLAASYRYGLGSSQVSVDDITAEFGADDRLIQVKERSLTMCTTKEVLAEERRMVSLARRGVGKMTPLYSKMPFLALQGKQADAVSHLLTSTSRVFIVRGAAGTGKTTLMREAIRLMENKGKRVTVVAPTAEASRGVLKEEGFEGADTVARLLVDSKMQEELEGQVLWVDEAGLLGTGDMTALLQLAEQKNARLILGGDTRQHASVIRGDALRILNTVGGIRAAEVTKIYRQKNVRYRQAVEDLSKGNVRQGFEKLDGLDAIKTIDPAQPNAELVEDYLAALKNGKTALVISPTHKQGDAVTEDIRQRLRKAGTIGKKEVAATRLVNRNLTAAQKGDSRNWEVGQVVQFNQNLPGVQRGSRWTVTDIEGETILVIDGKGRSVTLPTSKATHCDVFDKAEIMLSKGDKIKVTRNGFDEEEKRLNNGQLLEIVSVNKKGKIRLKSPSSKAVYHLDSEFGHLAHAHCITSHAAQGKTVDEVFIAQPSSTFSATDAKQFYVSVSRAREAAHIYTDDKIALLDHASELGERQSALELVRGKPAHTDYVQQHQRDSYPKREPERSKAPDRPSHTPTKDRDYEPEL